MTKITELTTKVTNGGTSERGRLSADEYNTLLTTVQSHEESIASLEESTIKNCGYFSTLEALQQAYPKAGAGSKAYVGANHPYAIYLWDDSASAWVDSGATGGDENVKLGDYYTKDIVNEKVAELESEKANKVLGKNLLNPNDITKGQGYWSYNDNNPIVTPQYSTSGYISVDGDIIINKATPPGTGHRVFDKDKNIIRVFTTQQYTYQEGDAFVRYTIATSGLDSAMIEKGTQVTSFEAYTENADIVEQIDTLKADVEKNLAKKSEVEILDRIKASAVYGKNLLNPNTVTRGKFYWNYNDNNLAEASRYAVTDYIAVDSDVILNIATPDGTGHRVFDKDKKVIRLFTTPQYTYQEGDAFVRFSILESRIDTTMVERGNVSTSFEMYTDKYDVVTLVEQTSEDIEQTNIKVGLTPKAEVAATSDASYNEVEYAIQKGHRYVITNTSEFEVADVRTIDSKGNKIDRLEVLSGGQSWNLIATDDASKVRVYFAYIGQNVTICEKPLIGDTIVERVETLEKDVTDLSKHLSTDIPYIIYKDEDIISITQAEQNGCVMRRRGYDIPKGHSGNRSMVQFSVRKLHKEVLTEFIINTNIPASKFDGSWGKVTQMGSGLIKVSVTPTLNNGHSTNCSLVFYSNETDKDWYLRLSQVHFYPQSAEALEVFAKTYAKYNNTLLYDVFKDFDETTEGYGETRFNSIVDAHKATSKQGYVEKYGAVIRVMPGIYNFAEYFPITEGESGYIGILTNTGEVFESFDIDMPETTRIEWDGHYGLADSAKLTSQQAMARCPFHVNTLFRSGGRPTIIRGFHFVCANIRYCIHPESAGYGNGQSWVISDCILDWNGSDKVDGFAGRNLGIGISCGEDGLVDRVKFGGTQNKGMGGHNNGYVDSQTKGVRPTFIAGASLKVRRCDLGDGNIYMTTFKHESMTPDSLIIEGCSNVATAYFGYEGDASGKQEWKGCVINSDIADNRLDV